MGFNQIRTVFSPDHTSSVLSLAPSQGGCLCSTIVKVEEEQQSICADTPQGSANKGEESIVLLVVPQEVLTILLSNPGLHCPWIVGSPGCQIVGVADKAVDEGHIAHNGTVTVPTMALWRLVCTKNSMLACLSLSIGLGRAA